MSACQSFSPVAPSFFLVKVQFLDFFEYRKGCGHIDMLMKYIWFMGLTSTVQA